jgi:hypothetical protein
MITRESGPPNIGWKTGVRAIYIDCFAGFRSGIVGCESRAYFTANAYVIIGAGITPDPPMPIFTRIRAVDPSGIDSGSGSGIILRYLM